MVQAHPNGGVGNVSSDGPRTALCPSSWVFPDLVSRLLSSRPIGSRDFISVTATEHGRNRRVLGYSAPMLVEESRMLQVSIFQTLQNNLASIDFSLLLIGVMTIADEVDSQLSQAMAGFTAAPPMDGRAA